MNMASGGRDAGTCVRDAIGLSSPTHMSLKLVSEAITRCRASQGRLDAPGHLLGQNRRLLNRAWWISGG